MEGQPICPEDPQNKYQLLELAELFILASIVSEVQVSLMLKYISEMNQRFHSTVLEYSVLKFDFNTPDWKETKLVHGFF